MIDSKKKIEKLLINKQLKKKEKEMLKNLKFLFSSYRKF